MQNRPKEKLATAAGNPTDAGDVSDAVLFMLARPRGVTVCNIVILPAGFDV